MTEPTRDELSEFDSAFERRSVARSLLTSPYIWGGLLTVGFYQLLPHLPVGREVAQRYFCGHPLEYVLAGMSFVGISILGIKLAGLRSERKALRQSLDAVKTEGDSLDTASQLADVIHAWPDRQKATHLGRRCHGVVSYVRGQKTAAGLEDHLKYLADVAADRLFESYSLLQTITWAVPIIGFLGTVMGITLAIANVTPDQLDTSLNEVTGGLAVAFDTTALALSLSLVLVFAYFFVKRDEERVLAQVEEIGIRRLLPLFPAASDGASPWAKAETQAAETLLDRTETLIEKQTELWQDSMETLRSRWNETLDVQQQQLADSLRDGTDQTLTSHADQLADLRRDFVQSYEQVSEKLAETISATEQMRQQHDATSREQIEQLWNQVHDDLTAVQTTYREQTEALVSAMATKFEGWESRLEKATAAVESQLGALSRQSALLSKIVEQEENLAGLQRRLTENLEAVRSAETFEDTLHSLSAAVHLLSTRARNKAA
ncbi:MotA/TolQ/ExbB proton channel family protein [Maioricimonas sp. JC845]|uniref:MotA/TolQ/ExbB proton channel family protein n=1 Tax=Maioricimonas sp. JC845 TaxID=3232138 RepID=UPI003458CBD1